MKNLVKFEELRTSIENCFEELEYEYEKFELEDNDLNYLIKFGTKEDENELINALGGKKGIVFVSMDDEPAVCFFTIVYKIKEKENINTYYKLVNDTNNLIKHGKFAISESEKMIIYKISRDLDSDYQGLSKEMLKNIIDTFIDNFYTLIFVLYKEREQDE